MAIKTNSIVLIATFVYFSSFAQISQYKNKRDILHATQGWHAIELPNEVFSKIQNTLNDIRIYGISKNNDTIEAPYILKNSEGKSINKTVAFKTLNQSKHQNGYYITFEIPKAKTINEIELNFKTTNFDWNVQLEGSQDLNTWFTLLDNYRVIAITNPSTQFKFSKLSFPDAKYQYFRVCIKSNKNPEFTNASLIQNTTTSSTYKHYKVTHFAANTKNKQTEIDIELPMVLPISYLELNTTNTFDYYRPVTIKYLADSTKTQQGWKYSYNTITSGILNSEKKDTFKFNSVLTKKIKVIIHNQDNLPLTISAAQVKGFKYQLTTRITQPAKYILVYGNTNVGAPNYDLSYFQDKIPENISQLALGKEQKIEQPKQTTVTPLFQNKIWLWSIMVGVIILLGIFTFKMMKTS